MKLPINNRTKFITTFVCFILSVVGFLVKLPSAFRHMDKELHSLFYFSAAALLNIFFANGNILKHILIFVILYLFGVSIEYAQEYSNQLLHMRIHGRYDPEDVKANLRGLVFFSIIWIIYFIARMVYKQAITKEATNNKK